jgi:TPR repeat protein
LDRQAAVLYHQGKYTQAFALFMKSAKLGDAHGEEYVASMYQSGLGVEKDYSQSLIWYRKAADQGNAAAEYGLGYMHQYGQGVGIIMSEAKFAPQPAPAPQQSDAQQDQGTCAVVYEAETHDNYGTHAFEGAAWAQATLEDAQAAARSALLNRMNGEAIDETVIGDGKGPGGGILLDASGCGFAHGAVAGQRKRDVSGNNYMGDGIYNYYYAALSNSIEAASSNAMAKCRNAQESSSGAEDCAQVTQW